MTSDLTGWPRGEGGEVLINMFCVRGFETNPLRVIFSELVSEGTKIDIYLIFLITHQKFVRSQKIGERIGTQNIEVRLSRIVKQPNVEKFQVCS